MPKQGLVKKIKHHHATMPKQEHVRKRISKKMHGLQRTCIILKLCVCSPLQFNQIAAFNSLVLELACFAMLSCD